MGSDIKAPGIKAPGLRFRTRADGKLVTLWIAPAPAVNAGFRPKTANLTGMTDAEIVARCRALQADATAFAGMKQADLFDGTLGSLFALYQTHGESPYHALRSSSRRIYDSYLRRLRAAYGSRRMDRLTGLDLKAWHRDWRATPGDEPEKLGAATMALAVIKAAFSFGLVAGIPECERLVTVGRELRLPTPKPRDSAPTAHEVELARAAAHRIGHPRAALAYALQFETMARQWDIAGQWVPMNDPRPSAIFVGAKKWLGPTWAAIDTGLVLTIKPTKTERSTGATIHVDLSRCPMVMEELALIPMEQRTGPLITHDGKPYSFVRFHELWRRVVEIAGLPAQMWSRDLRAGGVTEAQIAGATSEDRAKLAGHSQKINERIYARDRLAASGRVVELRTALRKSV